MAFAGRRRLAQDGPPLWLVVEPNRIRKTQRLAEAVSAGWGEKTKICMGTPPPGQPVMVWGHLWSSANILPNAEGAGVPWWLIDNGWHKPARGSRFGYYRFTYRSLAPIMLKEPDMLRLPQKMIPWRRTRGENILFALPGPHFGEALGLDMRAWQNRTWYDLRRMTKRKIVVRDKASRTPLEVDLYDAWCVVTHSSAVAVEAVKCGVPVIVDPLSAAAPMGGTSLEQIENPPMPDGREHWWASLMCHQFTINEMASGLAFQYLSQIRDQWESEHDGDLRPRIEHGQGQSAPALERPGYEPGEVLG